MKSIILATLASATVSLPALANPPPACLHGGPRSSYESGKQTGRNAVEFLWHNFGNETRMEEFMTAVTASLEFEPPTSDFVRCGNSGYADGVFEALNTIRMGTSRKCLDAGAAAGSMSGKIICVVRERAG